MIAFARDLPLPYLALVFAAVFVFAVCLAVIGGVLIESWHAARRDGRTLAEIDDHAWLAANDPRRRYR